MLPAALVLVPFVVVIVLQALKLSVHGENLIRPETAGDFVGLDNYTRALNDETLLQSIRVTVIYVVIGVTVQMLLGVAIALLMHRRFPGKPLVRALILIPMVLTPVVAGLTWRLLMDPTSGTINYVLGSLGLGSDHAFLANPSTALLAVILVEVWQNTPFVVVIVLAGLESLDPSPHEAARVDGASGWQLIWHVTLPLLKPVLAIVVLLRIIDAAKTFALVQTMTEGGPGTSSLAISSYVYRTGFEVFDIGYSTTLAVLTSLALVLLIFPLARRLMGFSRKVGRA
ncbi:carbohydrate ABC transporter permease [Phytoactinopolyspora endophytica]|uniref:carbohydrate ABC transporter permease n=1 Tax=Phytoactinopolyspora endophytica TaxID=1642495 RepID=UPI00101BB3AD|nr:sugar ABC transporter permease [Phytoactinopolyspora endophytica]